MREPELSRIKVQMLPGHFDYTFITYMMMSLLCDLKMLKVCKCKVGCVAYFETDRQDKSTAR